MGLVETGSFSIYKCGLLECGGLSVENGGLSVESGGLLQSGALLESGGLSVEWGSLYIRAELPLK